METHPLKMLVVSFDLLPDAACVLQGRSARLECLVTLVALLVHTCAFTLEISTEYSDYMQFSTEMKVVISDENSWIMDAI